MGTDPTFRSHGEQARTVYVTCTNWSSYTVMIMHCRQGPVVELLTRWKAEINPDNAAGDLCNAASMLGPLPKAHSCHIIESLSSGALNLLRTS